MSNANETLIRDIYAAFQRGDIPAFLGMLAPGFTLDVPGTGMLSGKQSLDTFMGRLGPAMEVIRGSFREDPISIIGSGDEVAALMAHQAERDGKLYRWRTVQWWRIVDGKASEFTELVDDYAAFEAVWRHP